MRLSFFEWVGRVLTLVLAMMVTLSIIGAIASIPSGSIDPRSALHRAQLPVASSLPGEQPAPGANSQTLPKYSEAVPSEVGNRVMRPGPRESVDPDRWLEAITYALIAVAGLGALAVLLLWRALGEWRRIADALEGRSSR